MKILALTVALVVTTGGLAAAASVSKTYSYFGIGGNTLDEIETELGRRGPQLNSSGKRHPGATRMEFTSRLGYGEVKAQGRSFCRITEARVSVKANVILPRWRQRGGSETDVKLIWDTLSADIKRHEESHVIIAKNHAGELEQALRALPRQPTCALAAERAKATTAKVLARHDAAQAQFDRVESINFEGRMLRLLRYRLQQIDEGRIPG